MATYDKPIYQSFAVHANAAISTTADIFQFVGPKGMTGRIVAMSIVLKTKNETAAGNLRIGIPADTDKYGTFEIPITAIDLAVQPTQAELDAFTDLPADTVITIDGDGLGTTGTIDLIVTIMWW